MRGARTHGRICRCSVPQEYASWGLVHTKAVRVSNGSCMPYQSMRRDLRIYGDAAGMVLEQRGFFTVEPSTATIEACPRYGQHATHCNAIQRLPRLHEGCREQGWTRVRGGPCLMTVFQPVGLAATHRVLRWMKAQVGKRGELWLEAATRTHAHLHPR